MGVDEFEGEDVFVDLFGDVGCVVVSEFGVEDDVAE